MSTCSSCGAPYEGSARFCPSCGSSLPAGKTTEPEKKSPDQGSSRAAGRTARIFFGVLLLFGLGFFVAYLDPSTHEVIQGQPIVAGGTDYGPIPVKMTRVEFSIIGDDFVFSLDDLKENQLVRFEYTGGKTPRSVMAYLAPDGRLVTAISLSEHCGSTEFEIEDNQIHCARCASSWDMMTMEAYACCAQYYPDPIPSRVVGDKVHISRSAVEDWAGRL